MKKRIYTFLIFSYLVIILNIPAINYAAEPISTVFKKDGDWEYVELHIPECKDEVVTNVEHNSKGFVATVINKEKEYVLFSSDFKNWSLVYSDTTKYYYSNAGMNESNLHSIIRDIKSLRVENDRFYYKFYNADKIITSADGINWSDSSYYPTYPSNIGRRDSFYNDGKGMAFNGNIYVKSLEYDLSNRLKYSADGINYFICNFDFVDDYTTPWDVYWLPYNNIFVSQGYGQTLYISNDGITWTNKSAYGSHGNWGITVLETSDKIYSFHQTDSWHDGTKDGGEHGNPVGHRPYAKYSDDGGNTWKNFSEFEIKVRSFTGSNINKEKGLFLTDGTVVNNTLFVYGAKATAKNDFKSYIGDNASYSCIDVTPAIVQYKPNTPPQITVSYNQNKRLGDNTIIKFDINVNDLDNNPVTITGTINGKSKATTVGNGNGTASLAWNTKEIGEGNFTNIKFTASDGKSITTYVWTEKLDIKYILKILKNQVETFVPDKSNVKRIIIADTDHRIIDDNTENRLLIDNIRSTLINKNCDLYFIGTDNEVTKTLAGYFE